ncbi:chemotaxis protein CheW [Ideonella sp.]|uniref:chemotaxis protein CheW n=1 Tax=Ideonella sp. TaxID=1929293 RepID=UPI00351B456D
MRNVVPQASSATLAAAATTSAEPGQYLTFMLAGEVFAIGILAIKEIIEYHSLTEVPMMPACVRGVINLRGAVVPVMDPLARFGRKSTDVTKRTCIVIVETEVENEGRLEHQVIGVVVDAVNEVLEIASSDIEPAPAFGARIRSEFIQGVGRVKGKFVILLDVNHVLSIDEVNPTTGTPAELAIAH